jgi:hypothetical protein
LGSKEKKCKHYFAFSQMFCLQSTIHTLANQNRQSLEWQHFQLFWSAKEESSAKIGISNRWSNLGWHFAKRWLRVKVKLTMEICNNMDTTCCIWLNELLLIAIIRFSLCFVASIWMKAFENFSGVKAKLEISAQFGFFVYSRFTRVIFSE